MKEAGAMVAPGLGFYQFFKYLMGKIYRYDTFIDHTLKRLAIAPTTTATMVMMPSAIDMTISSSTFKTPSLLTIAGVVILARAIPITPSATTSNPMMTI
ncbi:MAG: hypothetical protein COA87_016365 [Halomonas sp.]|nr:hypothetical protein [Halomonas sp.]MBL1269287.1 hypothetical protein [Halomonas sp.]